MDDFHAPQFNHQQAQDALRRMLQARERVARRNPFFASLIFNARLETCDRHAAIWTNSISVFFNPSYVLNPANQGYIEGDLLECVMKCALLHFPRRKHRGEDKWGMASHLSVRPIVHQYFHQHPDLEQADGLYPNKAVEEIYDLIPDDPEQDKQDQDGGGDEGEGEDESNAGGGNDDADQPGGMEQPTPDQEAAFEQSQKDWQRAVQNAKDKAVKAGNMPAELLRLVTELLPVEKLDWHDLIRDMSRDAKSMQGRTWSRINRRRRDPVMPGYADDAVFRLVCAFDVSGSIDVDTQFAAMKTEVAKAIDERVITEAVLIAVDTEPKIDQICIAATSDDVRTWHPRAGGGTDFTSAMEYIGREYSNAIGMVFLTDLETSSFGRKPPFPVVWVNFGSNKRLKAPFGRTCDYD
jgi:predicted metal-dependent peptidase